MGKQQNQKKGQMKMKVTVKFNNKYIQVTLEKGWKIQDLINFCLQKKPKVQKQKQAKSFLSQSDSGSEDNKIQYVLTDEEGCFEFGNEYLCKDLLQNKEYLAIIEIPIEEQDQVITTQKEQPQQENQKQLEEEKEKEQLNIDEQQQQENNPQKILQDQEETEELKQQQQEETEQTQQKLNQQDQLQQNEEEQEKQQVISDFSNNVSAEKSAKVSKKTEQLDDWEVIAEQELGEGQQQNTQNINEDYETQDEEEVHQQQLKDQEIQQVTQQFENSVKVSCDNTQQQQCQY